jgi:hypothetical protein
MNALPSLNGSVGYIFTSCNLEIKNSRTVPFKDMVERFKVYDQPHRPESRTEEWLAGKRVDPRGKLIDSWPGDDGSVTLTGTLQSTFCMAVSIYQQVDWMHFTLHEYPQHYKRW